VPFCSRLLSCGLPRFAIPLAFVREVAGGHLGSLLMIVDLMGLAESQSVRRVRLPRSCAPQPSATQGEPPGSTDYMGELKHECGVAAVYHHHAGDRPRLRLGGGAGGLSTGMIRFSVSRLVPRMLSTCQNPRASFALGHESFNPPIRDALLKTPQAARHGRRGLSPQPQGEVRSDHA